MDVVRCDECSTKVDIYCRSCDAKLCGECAGKHLASYLSKNHDIVPYTERYSKPIAPRCTCEEKVECIMFCQKCNCPICGKCLLGPHQHHAVSDLSEICESQRQIIQKETCYLESSFLDTLTKMICRLQEKRNNVPQQYEPLLKKIQIQGKKWHEIVDCVVGRHIDDVDKIMQRHLSSIDDTIITLKGLQVRTEKVLVDNLIILKNNKAEEILKYEGSVDELGTVPEYTEFEIPQFTHRPVKVEDIFTKFGFLTPGTKNEDKNFFVPAKENQTFDIIKSGFRSDNLVACVSKEEVWITGKDKIMKRFNSQNTLLETVDTSTGNWPCDVCLTKQGDLLYSDWNGRSVNLVNGGKIKRIVALDGWKPSGICPSSVGELLVCMQSHNEHKSKVVRFSKSVVIQEIQYDSNGQPLYSSGGYTMFVAENRNLDVCVSDFRAHQVTVVSRWGKLRFKYDGKIHTGRTFSPYAIDTDKTSRIFIVDSGSRCIHVIDADGHFLAYIPACGNIEPLGLSMKEGVMFIGGGNSDIVTCVKYNDYIYLKE